LIKALFRGLLKVSGKLKVGAPGHEQERILFRELPQVLLATVPEVANWWWSYDRGFLGTTLRCPTCGCDLAYKGDVKKEIKTPAGVIAPRRAYYRCSNRQCDTSVWPLDERLGLNGDGFLPSLQEIVVWLTSLDPYGKCLQFVSKLLHFTVCHRSAWLLTQKAGGVVRQREDEAIAEAFENPSQSAFPKAEVEPPQVGVVMFDGTCGRIDHDQDEPAESADEDPDAPPKPPDFREVKLGLAAHLVPPRPRSLPSKRAPSTADCQSSKGKRKVRPAGAEPTLSHKKLAVQLGAPLRLFQLVLLLVHRLGLDKAKTLLVIGDGARWIWCGVRDHLSSLGVSVVEVLDYWHAVEHLWKLARSVYGQGSKDAVAWVKARESQLLAGGIDGFFDSLQALRNQAHTTLEALKAGAKNAGRGVQTANEGALKAAQTLLEQIDKEINYFRNNESRIRYAEYLACGYLIGSGAMEGSCRHHVKERIDGPGMHWSANGAMAVLRNRTLIKNGEWDYFWSAESDRRWRRYQTLASKLVPHPAEPPSHH
jgi:hypothetical protein